MKTKTLVSYAACLLAFATSASPTLGQLFTENFDDLNAVSRWTANAGVGFDNALTSVPMDTNFDTAPFTGVDGINDDFSGFMFDYSTAGIPSAPNSAGGSTIGMKLQASLFSNALGGFSASPNSLNLTGDYSVTFDAWASTLGPFPGGGSGSTNLSTFGILSEGTTSQTILSSDGVFFAYTGDAGSGADFRAYSVEDDNSYDASPAEPNAVYHAGGRNAPEQLYLDTFGTGRTVPQTVIDAFPAQDMSGILRDGATAFAWQQNEIRKVGDLVEWYVNGFKLITVDMTNFATPTLGGNLSFGRADINFGSSVSPNAEDLLFTLIDNIEVNAITAVNDADFNDSGLVDGQDFLTWQRNLSTPDALNSDGDADGDLDVDADDLAIWETQYGGAAPLVGASIAAVPEPSTWLLLMVAAGLCYAIASPRNALAAARNR